MKNRSIHRRAHATATLGGGRKWRVIGGEACALDPAHPSTLVGDPCTSALAGGALLRLGLGRLDQVLGYALAGTAVPFSFLPSGRVALVTRIRDELVIDGDEVVSASGRWGQRPAEFRVGRRRRHHWKSVQALADMPDEIAALGGAPGFAWLGVEAEGGPVALPADWDPATGRIRVARRALAAVAADLPGAICVTLDNSGSMRPDEKLGLMLRGAGFVVDADESGVSVALEVKCVTYWCGFATTTSDRAA